MTGSYRLTRLCIQGMTGKTQWVTGKDMGFSYGQGFSEPVVICAYTGKTYSRRLIYLSILVKQTGK